MFLGADNVGKTSLVFNCQKRWMKKYNPIHKHHFTGPKTEDPWLEYYDFLKISEKFDKGLFICDRGFPETYFYELMRNGNQLEYQKVLDLIQDFGEVFNDFHIFIIKRQWELIEPYHVEEIVNREAKSGESLNLYERKVEYCAYYEFMKLFAVEHPYLVTTLTNLPENFYLEV